MSKVKFSGAVLVCGECEHRSSGPKKLRAKDVRKELKHGLGKARFRLRVVESTCLGLCPKKAMALVAVGATATPYACEAGSDSDVTAFAKGLMRASAAPQTTGDASALPDAAPLGALATPP